MKYLEQRVEELEKKVALLRAKHKLEETKATGFVNKHPIRVQNKEINDYMFNSSVNLMSEPDLETSFASPWDSSEIIKNPLDTITVNLSSAVSDSNFPNPDYVDSSDLPEYYPPYPDIFGSYDDKNFNNVINENVSDECGFKMNYEDWGVKSSFDKEDKRFLEYLNTKKELNMKTYTEQNIERIFGKIVSKFTILHHCWEGDGYGYVVEREGKKILVLTNHSNPYVATKEEINLKIGEYKSVIQETERAVFFLK